MNNTTSSTKPLARLKHALADIAKHPPAPWVSLPVFPLLAPNHRPPPPPPAGQPSCISVPNTPRAREIMGKAGLRLDTINLLAGRMWPVVRRSATHVTVRVKPSLEGVAIMAYALPHALFLE